MHESSDPVRPVTDDEVVEYRQNGWASLPGLVAADVVAEMLAAAQTLMTEERSFDDSWQSYRFAARDAMEPFHHLAFSPTMVQNVQRLARRDANIRLWVDTIACKMPVGSQVGAKRTRWHQDLPHAPHDRVGQVSIWLALNEVPPERGALRFLSGSQAEGPLGRVLGADGPDVVEQYPYLQQDYAASASLHLQAGDATCHSGLVVHSAPENTTDEPRWSYIFSYIPDDIRYTGAPMGLTDEAGIQPNGRFDSPLFPILAWQVVDD